MSLVPVVILVQFHHHFLYGNYANLHKIVHKMSTNKRTRMSITTVYWYIHFTYIREIVSSNPLGLNFVVTIYKDKHDRISKKIVLSTREAITRISLCEASIMQVESSRVKSMRVMWVKYSHRLGSMWVFKLSTLIDTNTSNSLNSLNSSSKYSLLLAYSMRNASNMNNASTYLLLLTKDIWVMWVFTQNIQTIQTIWTM